MSEKEVLVPNIGDFKDVEVIEVLTEAGSNIMFVPASMLAVMAK